MGSAVFKKILNPRAIEYLSVGNPMAFWLTRVPDRPASDVSNALTAVRLRLISGIAGHPRYTTGA
jgi:hypothetical protein